MENAYAGALMRLIGNGMLPKEAVNVIASTLRTRGRAGLLSRVGRAFARLAVRAAAKSESRITVARKEDAPATRRASGLEDAVVLVDDSLVGGWRAEKGDTLIDASYKKHLLEMYNRATRA